MVYSWYSGASAPMTIVVKIIPAMPSKLKYWRAVSFLKRKIGKINKFSPTS